MSNMRQTVDLMHLAAGTDMRPELGRRYRADHLPAGSVVHAGTNSEYVISRRGLCMKWEQPIPLSNTWMVTYVGRLAPGDWMTPRQRAEVDRARSDEHDHEAIPPTPGR